MKSPIPKIKKSFERNATQKNFTPRNRFTRQCIGESVIALMQTKDFQDITISDIVKKAGVSRMTFYHYFHTKTEVLNNYIHEIIESYIEECSRTLGITVFYDEAHIRHALLYFDKYADSFATLADASLHGLMISAINEYLQKLIAPIYPRSVYELYYFGGALLNVFLEWERGGKQESVDEMVDIIRHCCNVIP